MNKDKYVPQFGISWRLVICEDSVTNPLPLPLGMDKYKECKEPLLSLEQ